VGRDHEVEAADVAINVETEVGLGNRRVDGGLGQRHAETESALLDDLGGVLLHITAQSGPDGESARERGQVMEVGLAPGEGFELFLVVHVGFVTCAVDEPDVFAVAAVGAGVRSGFGGKEPLREATHGGDAGAGGEKDGVGYGLLKDEVAVRSMYLDGSTHGQVGEVGEMVGEETAFDAVGAEVKAVAAGRRCDGVGAGLQFAVRVFCDGGNELAGREGETLHAVEDELEVVALGHLGDADFFLKTCGIKLTCQGGSRFRKRMKPGCSGL